MDIVNRLRQYMEYRKIPITQFADTCGIPRPTLSQLLNGRNKKVSDELIGKIHDAYPSLSVLWLMFGEGDMLTGANMKISEPQAVDSIDFGTDLKSDDDGGLFNDEDMEGGSEKIPFDRANAPAPQHTAVLDLTPSSTGDKDGASQTTISFNPDGKKKIVNIIVYYNDNSFESFIPGHVR